MPTEVAPGAHAILILDQAGWHSAKALRIPSNISLLPLPPRSLELNPQENIWQFMRQNWLSNRAFKSFTDIIDHCCYAWNIYGPQGRATLDYTKNLKAMKILGSTEAEKEMEHPVVRTHPETGRKCLYINAGFTTRFKDMTVQESLPLLEYLWAHCTQPEFTCRFRWQPDSVAFWDNRAVQHNALNDYNGQRRVMHRVTVNGDRPV